MVIFTGHQASSQIFTILFGLHRARAIFRPKFVIIFGVIRFNPEITSHDLEISKFTNKLDTVYNS